MLKTLLRVFKINYKKYLISALIGFCVTLIIEYFLTKTNNVLLSALIFSFSYMSGTLFVDTQKVYSDNEEKSKFAHTVELLCTFFALFLLITFILEFGFNYEYSIIRMLIPFSLVILMHKLADFLITKE